MAAGFSLSRRSKDDKSVLRMVRSSLNSSGKERLWPSRLCLLGAIKMQGGKGSQLCKLRLEPWSTCTHVASFTKIFIM